jgi:hypothetical protein
VLPYRVIGDGDVVLLRDCGVAVDAKLHPAAKDGAENTGVVVLLRADQFIETIGTMWRPVAMGFDDEAACGGFELHPEGVGSLLMPERQSEQAANDKLNHVLQSSLSRSRNNSLFVPELLLLGLIESKGVRIAEIISLTIVSRRNYCGDGHSCPGD